MAAVEEAEEGELVAPPRRESSARWSSRHPTLHEEPPAQYRRPRYFRRFVPGADAQRRTADALAAPEHIVHVNDHHANAHFPRNLFITSKYTVLTFPFKNLYEQFRRVANSYFLVITAMQLVPGVSPFPIYITIFPLAVILGVTAVKEGWEDYGRHRSDARVNNALVTRLNDKGEPASTKSSAVRVGDIIAVDRDTVCSADIVVLATEHNGQNRGSPTCWVDTANLDGETRLKVRRAVPLNRFLGHPEGHPEQATPAELASLKAVVTSDPPNPWIEVFSGRLDSADPSQDFATQLSRENLILRGAVLRNTRRVWGVVVGAGPLTKLRLNQQLPVFKFSRLERALNRVMATMFIFQAVLCVILAFVQTFHGEIMSVLQLNPEADSWADFNWEFPEANQSIALDWFFSFMTWFILCSFLIPMSLYVIMEFGKLVGGLYIYWDAKMYSRDGLRRPARANTTSLVEELGEVQFILSDKTGTLTDNEMRFTHLATRRGGIYEVDFSDPEAPSLFHTEEGKRKSLTLPEKRNSRGHRSGKPVDADLKRVLFVMATCNELEVEFGDEEAANADAMDHELSYSGESPDEVALASSARDFGTVLETRSPTKLRVRFSARGVVKDFNVLGILPFNSDRKRMGVILQEVGSRKATVVYKGADNIMFDILSARHSLDVMQRQVLELSELGLRTLVLASVIINLDDSIYTTFKAQYEEALVAMEDRDLKIGAAFAPLEALLDPAGITGVEDKLSEGVEEALQSLVRAKVQVAVLTGDKTETAISICKTCGLFKPESRFHRLIEPDEDELKAYLKAETSDSARSSIGQGSGSTDLEAGSVGTDEAIIISGEALRACLESKVLLPMLVQLMRRSYTTVCTRMTPKQKALVTKLVRDEFGVVCLAIGDGANDVSMIREADVGIGVFGKEGAQAVNSADFAIHKFADLVRLLYVHGAGTRMRILNASKGSLFGNMAFNLPQVLYGIFSVWSGISIELGNVLTFYNLIMTSPFLLAISFFDRELLPDQLEQNPELYAARTKTFSMNEFREEVLFAIWHGLVAFGFGFIFAPSWLENGVVAGQWAEATALTVIVVNGILLNLMLRFQLFTPLHVFAMCVGFFMIWFASLVLPHIWGPNATDNGYIMDYINESPTFWVIFVLGIVASLLPFFAVKAYRSIWLPSPTQRFRERVRAEKKARGSTASTTSI